MQCNTLMQDQTSNSAPEFRNKIAGWIWQTEIIAINDSAKAIRHSFCCGRRWDRY